MGASVGPVMIGVSVSGGIRHRTASETLHTADDVLVGSKVRYLSNFLAAPHFGERPESLRVFGCLPGAGARGCTEADVRKASKEESAGSFAPAVVSVYGDLTRGCETLAGFRMGTPGA